MVKVPCQEVVWDIIPAMQAALTTELVSRGVPQIKVAKALSVAPSTVSQYLSGKRGYRISFDNEVKTQIGRLAEDINSGTITEEQLGEEFCIICRRHLRGSEPCDRRNI
jgi:predicted transcriptional regulator